jgi:hypothetical protein
MIAMVQTISCKGCRALYDAVANEKFGEIADPFDGPITGIRCPKNKDHEFEEWHSCGPCPKCGTAMDEDMPALWD